MEIRIEHPAVYTANLEQMREYYEKYFGAKSNSKYSNSDGFSSYFLTFSSGARLEIMSHTRLNVVAPEDKRSGYSHLAFSVGSRENVISLTERIVADGFKLLSPIRETGDGYFESCVSDPDGNPVEITV